MTRPGLLRMVLRGLLRRCPWCGGRGAFFTGWFTKATHCRSCGLRWRRGDVGFELGAAAVAAMITLGPLVLALAIGMAITWPDIAVVPMLAVLVPAAVLLPLAVYPVSYTLWQAFDLTMRPVEPDDFDIGAIVGEDLDEGAGPEP
ncbi:MAG: DUF983 domain-containing protein [Ilumatobacter sp.]|nr:DUF983 domain-containing protein [Ilumatobacter sp.]